uniref:Protein FAM33A n=1 Tax=Prolemur simus TaxID=1328070 RepID=A0A8C8Z5Z1_PROSS
MQDTFFQKADSDLDYIQYRLEYEIKTNHPDSAGEKNPVTLLKELSAIKSRYQTLYARFKPVAVEQKESKNRICATVNKTMNVIQKLQKQTDLEVMLSIDRLDLYSFSFECSFERENP